MSDVAATVVEAPEVGQWRRYTRVAIILHWVIAILIFGLLAAGLWMTDAVKDEATRALAINVFQLHKSIGLTVLALSIFRLVWRLLHPAPPLPAGMSAFDRIGAHISHVVFYGLIIGLPLTGWAMVSASTQGVPTFYFWLFEVPHWAVLSGLSTEAKVGTEETIKIAHRYLGYIAIGLIVVHIAAALKHHFVNRDAVLARMVPGVTPRGPVSEPIRAAGPGARGVIAAIAVVLVSAGGLYALTAPATDGEAPLLSADATQSAKDVSMTTGATLWSPVLDESTLSFSGTYSGKSFESAFESWSANIAFDEDNLEASRVSVDIDVASASLDNAQDDAAMKGKDWFHVAQHPTARFVAEAFRKGDAPGEYVADGAVTIRGNKIPTTLPFKLSIDGDRAEASATVALNRIDFELGSSADPNAMFVSKEIEVEVVVVALRDQ